VRTCLRYCFEGSFTYGSEENGLRYHHSLSSLQYCAKISIVKGLMKCSNRAQKRAEEEMENILGAYLVCYFRAQSCKTLLMITTVFHLIFRFEAPLTSVMKRSSFCHFVSCSPLKVNWRFGGKCRLHLRDERIIQERTSKKEVKAKGKLIPVPNCLALNHEDVWGSECILVDQRFLDLGTSWRWVVRFTILPL
jgi:hypothetical protein